MEKHLLHPVQIIHCQMHTHIFNTFVPVDKWCQKASWLLVIFFEPEHFVKKGEMCIRTLSTTLLTIFWEFILHSRNICISTTGQDVIKDHLITHSCLWCPKRILMILVIFFPPENYVENIWRRNVYQHPVHKSPSNILRIYALFTRYLHKYHSSRRPLSRSPGMIALTKYQAKNPALNNIILMN